MSLVLDSSVVAGWYLRDESSPYALAARGAVAAEGALVPSLWTYEITNLFLVAERRGRIGVDDAALALEALAAMPIVVRPAISASAMPGLARIAREHRLSAYDAAYLEVSLRSQASLATLDRALAQAAEQAGVPLFAG